MVDIRNEIACQDEVTRLTERQDKIGGGRSQRHVGKAKIVDTHPHHNPLVFLADVAQIDDAKTLFLREAADLTGVASLVEVLRETEADAPWVIWQTQTERTQVKGQLRVLVGHCTLRLAERAY